MGQTKSKLNFDFFENFLTLNIIIKSNKSKEIYDRLLEIEDNEIVSDLSEVILDGESLEFYSEEVLTFNEIFDYLNFCSYEDLTSFRVFSSEFININKIGKDSIHQISIRGEVSFGWDDFIDSFDEQTSYDSWKEVVQTVNSKLTIDINYSPKYGFENESYIGNFLEIEENTIDVNNNFFDITVFNFLSFRDELVSSFISQHETVYIKSLNLYSKSQILLGNKETKNKNRQIIVLNKSIKNKDMTDVEIICGDNVTFEENAIDNEFKQSVHITLIEENLFLEDYCLKHNIKFRKLY